MNAGKRDIRLQYRRFGRTNGQLSVFSLGTMRYLASSAIAQQVIQTAIAHGINHIETAQGYGHSEQYLGQAIAHGVGIHRDQLWITTKITPTATADEMATKIERSLTHLGLPFVDCLGIHGLNTQQHLDWITAPDGCMAAVRSAVAAGQVNHVGFSTHAPLEIILAAIATDQFEFVNLHYYTFFQRNEAAIALAHSKDMGVFIISPADKGGMLYTPPERLRQTCEPLSPLHLNYRFLLSDRRITTLSVGPATPDELAVPLQVADQTGPLSHTEQAALDRLHQQEVQALGRDRCAQCYQCLPCPEAIHIPEVLRLRNLAIAHDMIAFGQYRYRMFENAGHWFPGRRGDRCTECGDCLPRCPEHLDIPRLLQDTHGRLSGPKRRRLWEE
ncbi:MAG: aldo/keto reductase [Leptolyngbyaceae cyanobacterium]